MCVYVSHEPIVYEDLQRACRYFCGTFTANRLSQISIQARRTAKQGQRRSQEMLWKTLRLQLFGSRYSDRVAAKSYRWAETSDTVVCDNLHSGHYHNLASVNGSMTMTMAMRGLHGARMSHKKHECNTDGDPALAWWRQMMTTRRRRRRWSEWSGYVICVDICWYKDLYVYTYIYIYIYNVDECRWYTTTLIYIMIWLTWGMRMRRCDAMIMELNFDGPD